MAEFKVRKDCAAKDLNSERPRLVKVSDVQSPPWNALGMNNKSGNGIVHCLIMIADGSNPELALVSSRSHSIQRVSCAMPLLFLRARSSKAAVQIR